MLSGTAVACLPSLRPIYLMVITRSPKNLQSTQQRSHSRTWNGKSNFQVLSTLRPTYSESTGQLAVPDGEGNKSFSKAFVDAPSQKSDIICEVENIDPDRMHRAKDVIMVRDEVNVRISTGGRVSRV